VRASEHSKNAAEFHTSAERHSAEWKTWRDSEQWNRWNQAIAPALALRRRAFAILRDRKAVEVLFLELADRFADGPAVHARRRLAEVRLGDAGRKAIIEFTGVRDPPIGPAAAAPVVAAEKGAK